MWGPLPTKIKVNCAVFIALDPHNSLVDRNSDSCFSVMCSRVLSIEECVLKLFFKSWDRVKFWSCFLLRL